MLRPSEAQMEANRRNAQHGRGPRSQSGKHRSSQNALRHGLTGRVVVLPTEDMEEYKRFSKEIVDSLHPASPMEAQFAQTVADTQWRLNRARTFEDGMIALGHFEEAGNFTAGNPNIHAALTAAKVFRERSKDFVNLSLYEQRLSRAQKEAMRQLRDLQAERKAAAPPALDEVRPLAQVATAAIAGVHVPTPVQRREAQAIGFVYSTVETLPIDPLSHEANRTVASFQESEKRAA
jgi:hypothetical protein